MSPFRDTPQPRPDPRLSRALWQCLSLGLLLCLCLPPLRGHNLWLGWMPFWLVLAPSLALLLVHRHRLLPRRRRQCVPDPRRRHRLLAVQERRASSRLRLPHRSPRLA
jgi:hypothetical protein